jgi:hypothetical protein
MGIAADGALGASTLEWSCVTDGLASLRMARKRKAMTRNINPQYLLGLTSKEGPLFGTVSLHQEPLCYWIRVEDLKSISRVVDLP